MSKTTFQTAIVISNGLVGSAMIIFPLNYLRYGILQNFICLLLMGFVLATTCSVFGMHLRPSQTQVTQIVKRVLGETYFKTAALLSGVLVTLVSVLFFLLASDILYDVSVQIFGNLPLPEKLFKLILMLGFACLTFLKNLEFVFKAAPFAMFALIASTVVLVISFPLNISELDRGAFQPKQFSLEGILLVSSINGFAFTCHPSISPILKENNNQKNNKKAIYLGFAMTSIIYFLVGVCGSLAIYGKNPEKSSNVINYFSGSWQAPVIGVNNFIYFFMIFPIFPFVGKNQLISLVPEQTKKHPRFPLVTALGYAIVWLAINTFFILSELSPGKLMGFLGSVVSFYFTYLLPVMIMFRAGKTVYTYCPKTLQEDNLQNRLNSNNSTSDQTTERPTHLQKKGIQSIISNDSEQAGFGDNSVEQFKPLNAQDSQVVHDMGYTIRHQPLNLKDKVGFGAIFLLGSVLFISQVVDTIKSL